jgi:uncharacterized protein involved in tolerance to divalent cations
MSEKAIKLQSYLRKTRVELDVEREQYSELLRSIDLDEQLAACAEISDHSYWDWVANVRMHVVLANFRLMDAEQKHI